MVSPWPRIPETIQPGRYSLRGYVDGDVFDKRVFITRTFAIEVK